MVIEPEGWHSPRAPPAMVSAGSGAAPAQPDNVGILAAEVYFPSTYVRNLRDSLDLTACGVPTCPALPSVVLGLPGPGTVRPDVAPPPCASGHVSHSHLCSPAQVRQEDLEKHDGVPTGKYSIGLGQVRGGTCVGLWCRWQEGQVPTCRTKAGVACLAIVGMEARHDSDSFFMRRAMC